MSTTARGAKEAFEPRSPPRSKRQTDGGAWSSFPPSAGEVGGEREGGGAVAGLSAIDLQVFQHPLDIEAGLVERDQLDPVDHADVLAARVAEIMQPLPHPPRPGVV